MKYKLYNFSQEKNLQKINDTEISKNFEIIPVLDMPPDEILNAIFVL